MTETIEQRVKRVISTQFNVKEDQITSEASFVDDLGADSLDQVQLVMDLEEEFKDVINGEIPEGDAEKLRTVGDAVRYITEKAAAN